MKRRFISTKNGKSQLTGYDVGQYPLHRFAISYLSNVYDVTVPLQLQAVGDDEWIAGCYRHRVNSDVFSIEFVQKGTFILTHKNKRYEIGENEIFLVHYGEDCIFETNDYALKKAMLIIGSAVAPIVNQLGLDQADKIVPSYPERLRGKFDHAYRLIKEMPSGYQYEINGLVYQVLLELADDFHSNHYPQELNNVLDFMQRNIANPLTMADLCRQSGMSASSLQRLFTQHLQSSPIDYFIKLKINRAKDLLNYNQHSIKEISQLLGYSNQLYFSAEFKKRTGYSPKVYREHY